MIDPGLLREVARTGGPAYPSTVQLLDRGSASSFLGTTLRDYFAARAMQGLVANPETDGGREAIANWSYRMADAMLKAREAA